MVGGSWVDPDTGTDDLCGYALGTSECRLKDAAFFENCSANFDDFETMAGCVPTGWFTGCGPVKLGECE